MGILLTQHNIPCLVYNPRPSHFTPNPARLSSTYLDALLEHGSDPHADVGGHDVHQTEPGKTLELVNIQLKTQALTPPLSNTIYQQLEIYL